MMATASSTSSVSRNIRLSVADPASFLTPPRCAYTAQVPRLFSMSLRDNLLLSWMHTRLFAGFVLRLPLLVWRRATR